MNESGFLFLRKFGKISIRKIVPESGTQGESGNGGDQKKVVPESGTQGESGNGGDQKKVVPKSGTQRECRNRQRSEESCTGIRYAGKIRKWAVIERKLYRNSVRQGESGNGGDQKKVVPESGTQRECGNRQRSEESCTGIRYAGRIRERRRSEESCTEIRYVIEKIENGMEAHQDLVRFLCSKKENMGRII